MWLDCSLFIFIYTFFDLLIVPLKLFWLEKRFFVTFPVSIRWNHPTFKRISVLVGAGPCARPFQNPRTRATTQGCPYGRLLPAGAG